MITEAAAPRTHEPGKTYMIAGIETVFVGTPSPQECRAAEANFAMLMVEIQMAARARAAENREVVNASTR